MQIPFNSNSVKDETGALVFRYGKAVFWFMVTCSIFLLIAVIIKRPTKLIDIAVAVVLIVSAIFMAIQSASYELVLRAGVIQRSSPWFWDRRRDFPLKEIREIDIKYQSLHGSLIMRDGTELKVPFLLNGGFQLLSASAEKSEAQISPNVKKMIDYYS